MALDIAAGMAPGAVPGVPQLSPGAERFITTLLALQEAAERRPDLFSREELARLNEMGASFGIKFPVRTQVSTLLGNMIYNALDTLLLGLLPDSLGTAIFGEPVTEAERIAAGVGDVAGFAGSVFLGGPLLARLGAKALRGAIRKAGLKLAYKPIKNKAQAERLVSGLERFSRSKLGQKVFGEEFPTVARAVRGDNIMDNISQFKRTAGLMVGDFGNVVGQRAMEWAVRPGVNYTLGALMGLMQPLGE